MAHYREHILDIDLESGGVDRSFLNHPIGEGDNAANRYGIRVFRNGQPVTLGSATVQGYFVRHATGETVLTGNGVVTGNVAYVTLPQSCYAVEGNFSLTIKLTGGGVTGTMRIIDGTVVNTTTDTIIDPGQVIPSIEELIAMMEEVIEAAQFVDDLGFYLDEEGYVCQRLRGE